MSPVLMSFSVECLATSSTVKVLSWVGSADPFALWALPALLLRFPTVTIAATRPQLCSIRNAVQWPSKAFQNLGPHLSLLDL